MEINNFNIGAPNRNHDIEQPNKFHSLDMLKESGGLPSLVHPVQSKQREFIDHTLLAPEFIRDTNHFIMDLIDQQVVFQKPTLADATFVEKEQSLNSDLQFQNAIFQFVNKHGQVQCAIPDDGVTLVGNDATNASQPFDNKVQTNFLTLNETFLSDPAPIKNFNMDGPSNEAANNEFAPLMSTSLATICNINQQNKPSVADLTLLGEEVSSSSSLIQNSNLFCAGSSYRKVLPHKKRISKKLKAPENKAEYSLAAVELSDQSDKNQVVLIKQQKQTLVLFNCELCGHTASTQLDFFTHLKKHYEPKIPVLKSMARDEPAMNSENTRVQDKKMDHNNVAQVFPDVHIDFEDFHPVHSSVVGMINQSNENDDIKILNSNSLEKCMQFVAQNDIAPPKLVSTEEIEFSDTEDMLEGIRNVVDKVSIEDTCDAVDIVTSNTMRTPWFANNSFNGKSLNRKLIENENFSNSITNQFDFQKVTLSTLNEVADSSVSKSQKLPSMSAVEQKNLPPAPYSDCDKMDSLRSEDTFESDCNRKELKLFDEMSDSEFLNDIKLAEKKKKKRTYLCTQCNREFNSNNALKYHSRTHTGVRPHHCDVCGKSFFAQGALKSHKRTHTGDKPFDCEHCDQKFRQMGDLKYHVESRHNSIKCYQCEFCGKSFSRKYSLVVHRRIHTSERDYKCEFCPMSFRASIYLQNHRKIHTGERPYQCETCSKKFRVSGDLKRHQLTHKNKKSTKKPKAKTST